MKFKFAFFWLLLYFVCPLSISAQSDLDRFYPGHIESFGRYAIEIAPGAVLPENVQVLFRAQGWTHVLAGRNELYELLSQGIISKIYREPALGPAELNDSMRKNHFVNEVHQGLGLDFAYKGKGVIMGYVDSGLDPNHADFKDSLGKTRVLRYWNQGQSVNFRTPAKYGYGRAYKNTDINTNFNIVGNINQSAHGTTVTGCGSGNGLANGRNKGVAPECNIVIVRNLTTFPSWTLTVADGVDYIFSVADSLGMPAVVNLSIGTYLGSHDGKDPAGLYIDSLLNDKAGRIVVCAAGNSGSWPAYHVQKVLSSDTNFVWMIPNPALAYGSPGVYFDLWADTTDIQNMHFAFGADAPGPVYRGNTTYKQVNFANQTVQYETIFGINNDVIGNVIYQGQVVGSNYNLQAIVFTDSLDYRIRFLATGAGKIDMWSSSNIGGSNFSLNIPDLNLYPEFVNYMMPDTLQSIVSSWACSDRVITVGNTQNRKQYIDVNGNVFPVGGGTIPSGQLSANSSKGPNRQGNVKPDVVASGDMSLSARVLTVINTPDFYDIGNMHVRNGATSMASPVVAGIAALYLEKCSKATWQDFKNHLTAAAFTDNFTGNNLPNYAFGYGKAHALNTLIQSDIHAQILGSPYLCLGQTELEVVAPNLELMVWNTNDSTNSITVTNTGSYHGLVENSKGCKNYTDTLVVVNDNVPPAATAPDDTWVSCLAGVPAPDVSSVTNLSDNCGIDHVEHLSDFYDNDGCNDFVARTYRVHDVSSNYTDVVQIITLLNGAQPQSVSNGSVVPLVHVCNGVFIEENDCESKYMLLDPNGNSMDWSTVDVTIHHGIVDPYPVEVQVIDVGNTGYYETSDGVNTFRVSRKMYTVQADGVFNVNGGVLARLYFDGNDFDAIVNDEPNYGEIVTYGWFKSEHHDPVAVVDEMSASSPLLASSTIIFPVNSGEEQGVNFVDFLVNSFSTFGFYAATIVTPLPVELSNFSVQCTSQDWEVQWSTASESGADYFVVEWSRNGQHWNASSHVQASGNTTQSSSYQIMIPKQSNESYFRLIQNDFNGNSRIYGPIFYDCGIASNNWQILPSNDSQQLAVELNSLNINDRLVLSLVDLSGRDVNRINIDVQLGSNLFTLDVSTLPSGVYIIYLNYADQNLQPIKFALAR